MENWFEISDALISVSDQNSMIEADHFATNDDTWSVELIVWRSLTGNSRNVGILYLRWLLSEINKIFILLIITYTWFWKNNLHGWIMDVAWYWLLGFCVWGSLVFARGEVSCTLWSLWSSWTLRTLGAVKSLRTDPTLESLDALGTIKSSRPCWTLRTVKPGRTNWSLKFADINHLRLKKKRSFNCFHN